MSSTLAPGGTSSRRSIAATVLGCELVWPWMSGRGRSSSAWARCAGGRNARRASVVMASVTASEVADPVIVTA